MLADLRLTLRSLRRTPSFAATAVLLASAFPARAATRVEPVTALRGESE